MGDGPHYGRLRCLLHRGSTWRERGSSIDECSSDLAGSLAVRVAVTGIERTEAWAAALSEPQGVVAEGMGYAGDLEAAVTGLGATQAIASVTGKEVWLIREVGDDSATVGAPPESWAAFRLVSRPIADGRTIWVLFGDVIAGAPCPDASVG